MTSAPAARDRPRTGRSRRTIVIFLVLAALLPGLTAAVAAGFASYYGECRWEPHPDPIICNAG
ncbi:hypothetical protein GCM10009528_35680 [Kineococcus aurantiacus]